LVAQECNQIDARYALKPVVSTPMTPAHEFWLPAALKRHFNGIRSPWYPENLGK